jgi:hypothetical protein
MRHFVDDWQIAGSISFKICMTCTRKGSEVLGLRRVWGSRCNALVAPLNAHPSRSVRIRFDLKIPTPRNRNPKQSWSRHNFANIPKDRYLTFVIIIKLWRVLWSRQQNNKYVSRTTRIGGNAKLIDQDGISVPFNKLKFCCVCYVKRTEWNNLRSNYPIPACVIYCWSDYGVLLWQQWIKFVLLWSLRKAYKFAVRKIVEDRLVESLPQFSWIQLRHYATHARQSRLILIFLVRRHFFCVPLHKTRYCSSRFNPIKVETPPNNLDANQIKTSNVTHLMHFLHLHHQPWSPLGRS